MPTKILNFTITGLRPESLKALIAFNGLFITIFMLAYNCMSHGVTLKYLTISLFALIFVSSVLIVTNFFSLSRNGGSMSWNLLVGLGYFLISYLSFQLAISTNIIQMHHDMASYVAMAFCLFLLFFIEANCTIVDALGVISDGAVQ